MQPSLSYPKAGRTEQWLITQQLNLHYVWWAIVSVMNLVFFIVFYRAGLLPYLSGIFSVSNLLLAILVQNELILHFLYQLAISVSKKVAFGKYYINASVHHIAEVHAASASWGFLWFLINVLQSLNDLNQVVLVTTSFPLLILLLSIIVTATPLFRHRFHNASKAIHRYLGWLSLIVLTLHVILLHFSIDLRQVPTLEAVLADPMLLITALLIVSIALPRISLQRCDCFAVHCPSPGVLVLTVPGTANIGTFAQISLDLTQWHSFSIVGMYFDQQTDELNVQLIISATEDWTASRIDRVHRKNFPDRIWIRSAAAPGFMSSIHAYSWALIIATEAGIIPVLPYLAKSGRKLCLLWIGNHSQELYGELVWTLLSTHPFVEIHDAGPHGNPKVSELAAQAIREFRPEAVFCVSNKATTEAVVQLCLAEGIPAYGAT